MFQTKEQNKSPEIKLYEIEISELPNREFKIAVIKMFTEIKRAMYEQTKNFNRDRKY